MGSIRPILFAAALLLPTSAWATAVTEEFNFSTAPIIGQDPDFVPDVTISFSYYDTCGGSCELTITLTYNGSSNGTGGLTTIGQTLTGVSFDLTGSNVSFLTSDPGNLVTATGLVGQGSPGATTNVTPQYAFGTIDVALWGTYALSSVGDINFGADSLGRHDVLPGVQSDLEPNAPNGTSFSIVDPFTCEPGTCGGLHGGFQDKKNGKIRVWIQNSATATLVYDGTITGVENVNPFFGTDGAGLVPEPSASLLFLTGSLIVGQTLSRRRHRARR